MLCGALNIAEDFTNHVLKKNQLIVQVTVKHTEDHENLEFSFNNSVPLSCFWNIS